jgi:hypothetical protein
MLTIAVKRRLADHFTAVLEKGLTELLRESVVLSELNGSVVDGVLHVVNQAGIGTVHDDQATSGDVTVDGGQAAEAITAQQRNQRAVSRTAVLGSTPTEYPSTS